MSAVAERTGTVRVCPSCDEEFLDTSTRTPRIYCWTCSPPRHLRGRANLRVVKQKPRVAGRPFTVAHFRRWSARFKLKDGSQFELEAYQALFLKDLFARKNGRPAYAELWLLVPEGNGKTTFGALLVLYMIEFRPEAWVPVAASARDQAVDLTYRICSGFIERNKLEDEYRTHPGYRSIIHRASKGAAKIFASDAASGDGVDPDLAIIEELHRLQTMDLYETWAGKLDKSGGQLVIFSTAGAPDGAFEKLRTKIRLSATSMKREGCFLRAVGNGVVLHEYAIPEDGDPEDLELVASANPFSAKTVEAIAAKRAKPSWNLSHWRRFTCNLPTRDKDAAITELEWASAHAAEVDVEADAEWWLGLDVAWRWDTTAIVPLWWRDDEFRYLARATILEPPRTGASLDPSHLKRAIADYCETLRVTTVVMDPNKAEDIAAWMSDELGLTVIERLQSSKPQSEDYERFMQALRQGWLKHSGDPGLRQHALNAVTKILPNEGARFARSSDNRRGGNQDARVIDALIAAAMVHSVRCDPPRLLNYRVAGFR